MTGQAIRAFAICGPTSSGKSEIALRVAQHIGGEIINADSRQVYRDLEIGTGAPSGDALARVPHHLYAFVDPCVRYSAGAYVNDATRAVEAVAARGRVPIVVGGTGLYVEALAGTMPLDRPFADEMVRERVRREASAHGHPFLRAWLETIDPAAARRIPGGDRYRTLRALEAVFASRAALPAKAAAPHFRLALTIFVLTLERAALVERIEQRVQSMFERGIVEEAVAVRRRCADAPALTGLGFAEAVGWYLGISTWHEAIRDTVRRTVRYAKRQQTWFRRMHDVRAVDASDPDAAAAAIVEAARERASPA